MRFVLLFAVLQMMAIQLTAQSGLAGFVNDTDTGEPIVGALVSLEGTDWKTLTDVEGYFKMSELSNGNHVVVVELIGYYSNRLELELTGKERRIKVQLTRDPLVDGFVVKDPNRLSEVMVSLSEIKTVGLSPAVVEATSASASTPVTHRNVNAEEIKRLNNGQDLPYLLRFTPSVVVTSDAGNGIGYTGLRIRGSDATRINVTINGVPLNDSESQGVFWVDLPDFASSTDDIQIQRGIGTSTHGAGAFGGTVKMNTLATQTQSYATVSNTYGSFNTWKNSVSVGTGLIDNHYNIEARLSQIMSDGYIDRATADLKSYFVSGSAYFLNTTIRLVAFGGKERTYQSWYGTPESRLENDTEGMLNHAINNGYSESQLNNLLNAGRTYNFYEYKNEVDDYNQDHYQVHILQLLPRGFSVNLAGHYTYGRGYYEQFKEDDSYATYGMLPLVVGGEAIGSTDVIRRRWLENDFYGGTWAVNWNKGPFRSVLGGAYNVYDGDHFGELVWMDMANQAEPGDLYYLSNGYKTDFNVFGKTTCKLTDKLSAYVDLQVRKVTYETRGLDSDRRFIDVADSLLFFNPKVGINYQLSYHDRLYVSYAQGHREPTRGDYIDIAVGQKPKPESMTDIELGYQRSTSKYSVGMNLFYMDYSDQLVLTGELNDVGTPLRQNVDRSFRRGLEIDFGWNIMERLNWSANVALSQNQIKEFNETLYDYTNGYDIIKNGYSNTDIAFSPSMVAASQLTYRIRLRNNEFVELGWMTKYVGQQFMDNTANSDRALDAYLVNDARLTYTLLNRGLKEFRVNLLVNNFLSEEYSSNGYTYSYIYGQQVTENFYYPQAGRNFLLGVELKF